MKAISLVTLFFALCACGGNSVRPEPDLVTKQSVKEAEKKIQPPTLVVTKGENYEVTYPYNWEILRDYYGTDSMAISLPENDADNFRENVNLVFEKAAVKDHKAYYNANLPSMKTQLKNFSLVSVVSGVSETGLPFTDLIYTHEGAGVSAKNRAVFFHQNGVGFVITSTSRPETFDNYYDTFDRVVQSFTILNP